MRIGVDIDGVLNRRQEFILEYGSKYCLETGRGHLQDPNALHFGDMYGWTKPERDDFWDHYGWLQMYVLPAQLCASDVIKKLKADGHEIWIVTGRNNGDRRVLEMPEHETWDVVTRRWLQNNEIYFDEFGFNHQNKGQFCRDNQIDVMIEDDPGYLETFDEQTKVFIFNQPYNRNATTPNCERVFGWYDIYNKIRELEK